MGMMDNIKGKMQDMNLDNMDRDAMMEQLHRLEQKEADGMADDNDRTMLGRLRERLNMGNM